MNFHSDDWIMERLNEHYKEACAIMGENRVVGIFYQGSGNYGLDYASSDVDTKCVIIPTLEQLVMESKPSYTHIRDNDEHIDFKDIRLMLEIFHKGNINFLEILYTKYYILNPLYETLWNTLVEHRDEIIKGSRDLVVKSMVGIAREKYHALEHRYPSRIEWIDKFGYDPKQLHHLLRLKEFISRWADGESFENCLIADESTYLVGVKLGCYNLEEARKYGKRAMDYIEYLYKFLSNNAPNSQEDDTEVKELLESISFETIRRGVQTELGVK